MKVCFDTLLFRLIDSSVEGIISTPESGKQVWGCQFHPESAGGPLDTIEVSFSKRSPVCLLISFLTSTVCFH